MEETMKCMDGVMVAKVRRELKTERGKVKAVVDRLVVNVPDGMTGERLLAWVNHNAGNLEYVPVERPVTEFRPQKKIIKSDEFEAPLMPYAEEN